MNIFSLPMLLCFFTSCTLVDWCSPRLTLEKSQSNDTCLKYKYCQKRVVCACVSTASSSQVQTRRGAKWLPCLVQWMAMDHISPAPLPSPVSVRCPYNGVKGVKRFPHSLADAINTALTTAVHSADGKIPNDFITISLVSLRSQSLQAS